MSRQPFALTLFGPFEARYDGQPLTGFATDKIRALLAYLAIESGKPHRRETLAALLWPDYPDEIALRNLRQSLYRMRQTLQEGHPSLPGQLITQTRPTISLNPEFITLDTANFTQHLQDARFSPDPIPLLSKIPTLYRGELLQGLSIPDAYAFDEWLSIQREVFHQQALEALTRLLALQEARNDFDGVLITAGRLLALEPWHEEAHRQIMRAHVQKNNRPQAIAQYHELKTILTRDLGVEPAPTTIALFNQIQSGTTPVPSPPLRTGYAGESFDSTPALRHRIPSPLTPIIGRKSELDYLTETLQDPACRLLTLTGPGGMGKTRLCIETAHRLSALPNRFTDGIVYIPLAQIEHGGLLVSTLAQSLGLNFQSRTNPRQELIDRLQNQHLLLILDNFEHLLASSADEDLPIGISFLVEVLSSAPGITFFITSRDPLTLQAEWVYPLEGLPHTRKETSLDNELLNEPAPQLFIQNARRYRPSFDPVANTHHIIEICRLTDGLPLALEMAAAWMRVYNCEEIAQSISQSLDFLTSPFRDTPARQRSIRAIFESTWDQLNPEQQNVLMALSVFRGGFTMQAALSITEASILDMALLVEKSLLRRVDNKRYFLHELVCQFSGEKLAASGKGSITQERHARYLLTYLAEQSPGLNGLNPLETLTKIRLDLDNLRLAWSWAVSHADIRLLEMGMDGLTQFWILTGGNLEGEAAMEEAIHAVQMLPQELHHPIVYSYLESYLAWLRIGLGKNQDAEQNIRTALTLSEGGQNASSRAFALSLQGWLLQTQGHLDTAERALDEARSIFEITGNLLQMSLALIRIGSIYWRRNMMDRALAYYQQSLEIEQRIGNKRGINRAYGGIGMAHLYLDNYDKALEFLKKALQLDRELGNQPGIPRHLGNMGNIYLRQGKYDEALACFQEALGIEQKIGNKNIETIWLGNLGRVYTRLNDHTQALIYFEQAIPIARETGNRFHLCEVLLGKAEILIRQNRNREAQIFIDEALSLSAEIDRKDTKLEGQILKARLLANSGELQTARRMLETSLEAYPSDRKETEAQARIYYELWKIDRQAEDARHALELYQTCLTHAEQIEYSERIAELVTYLSPHEK